MVPLARMQSVRKPSNPGPGKGGLAAVAAAAAGGEEGEEGRKEEVDKEEDGEAIAKATRPISCNQASTALVVTLVLRGWPPSLAVSPAAEGGPPCVWWWCSCCCSCCCCDMVGWWRAVQSCVVLPS